MADEDAHRRGPRRFSLRALPAFARVPAPTAAAVTGLVCGAVATGLVWSGERGCDAVRGRPSCGGYGLPLHVLIVVACFALGVILLGVFGVGDPEVTSFFGIALPLLAILTVLLDDVFDTWMAFVLPLLVSAGFVLATYLARVLDAANPSPYAEGAATASGGSDDEVHSDPAAATNGLPRYAASDDVKQP